MINRKLRLFVYGTLKQGCSNHALLCGAPKIANGHTVRKMVMMHTGKFPVVFARKPGDYAMLPIAGEVYEIEDHLLPALDQLEDRGGMYDREIFNIRTAAGEVLRSIMYVGRLIYWTNSPAIVRVKPLRDFYAWSE